MLLISVWKDNLLAIVQKSGQCKNLRGKFINCYLCLQIHSLKNQTITVDFTPADYTAPVGTMYINPIPNYK